LPYLPPHAGVAVRRVRPGESEVEQLSVIRLGEKVDGTPAEEVLLLVDYYVQIGNGRALKLWAACCF
jgi:hypothetical protein